MAPIRPSISEAAAAAAPAITKGGRVKKVSQAAMRAMSSKNHENQQARRARTGTRGAKSTPRSQLAATSTPKVVITAKSTAPRTRRSPLSEINNTVHQRVQDHRTALALPTYSASQPQTQGPGPTLSTSSNPHRRPTLSSTPVSVQHPTQPQVVASASSTSSNNSTSNDPTDQGADDEAEDRPGNRHHWQDEEDDWEDGMSDAYVPSDTGGDEDQDGVQLQESANNEQDPDVDDNGMQSGAEETEEESTATVKIRARQNSKKVKKTQPKASDYSEDVEALLNSAAGLMRALVMSENPMPSVDESINLASDAYELTKRERPHVQPPDDIKYIPILRRAIPQVRGRVKDAARARTGDAYGFDDRPRMGQKNRRRYLTLVEKDAYIYEKPDTLDGPYYHPLCYKIIKTCFFGKASDDGVVFSEFFSPIRPQTVALVYTAIRMSLDEWKSGSYKPLNFTSDLYEPVYKSHLANLKAMDEDDPLFLKGLGDELWEDCSEPFDLAKATQPMVTICEAQKASGIKYGQERRNARAVQKAAAAATTAAAAADMVLDE